MSRMHRTYLEEGKSVNGLGLADALAEVVLFALLVDLVSEDTDVAHVDTFAVENLCKEEPVGDVQSRRSGVDEECIESDVAKVLTRETNVLRCVLLLVKDLGGFVRVLRGLTFDEGVRVEVELEVVGVDDRGGGLACLLLVLDVILRVGRGFLELSFD